MKNKYMSILPYTLILLVFAFCGCVKDTADTALVNAGQYSQQLVLNVKQPLTRATETDEQVMRLDILLFKDGKFEKAVRNITSFDNVEGKNTVTISVDSEGVRDIYTVANAETDSWIDSFTPGVTPVEDMLNIETQVLTKMANPPLIMYGLTKNINFGEFGGNTPCELYRIVARIDIKNLSDNFQIHSARLVNSKKASKIFPGAALSTSAIMNFEMVEAANGGVTLYSYENSDINAQTATTIEIAGEADGKPLTYKVDFKAEDKQIAIERNHLYTVNVNNVTSSVAQVTIVVKPWIIGDDIDHTVAGNAPQTTIEIDNSIGTVNMADSTINLHATGGAFKLLVKANAECAIELSNDWMQLTPQSRAQSSIESQFEVTATANGGQQDRIGQIKVYNKLTPKLTNTFIVRQELGDDGKDKYLVIAVAGQSNAVGYDESVVFPNGIHAPIEQAFQLSYRTNGNLQVVPLTWCADDVENKSRFRNASGLYGVKGIHLPLAKELVKRIPTGYKLLFVNVAFSGASFIAPRNTSMAYDVTRKCPGEMGATLMWGVGRPYYRTLVDRVKYALDLNPNNKFLGVVWCQGEADSQTCDDHYDAFNGMTDSFFRQLNSDGYGSRCPKGVADKDLWYSFSSAKYWVDWRDEKFAGSLFGGYKQWNPNTFIHIPNSADDNRVGGTGVTGDGKFHFGNDAYTKVIAPLVAQAMDDNGGLFNGNKRKDRFNNNITSTYASTYGGKFSDADVQQSLVLYMPFTNTDREILVGNQLIARAGTSMVDANDLTDINGNPRNRKVVAFSKTTKIMINNTSVNNNYSIAFMIRRTGSMGEPIQTFLTSTISATAPFIGFRDYVNNKRNAHMTEFAFEPIYKGTRLNAVPGQLFEADNVSSLTQWIHYVVTYDHISKICTVYMNGQQVEQVAISNTTAMTLSRLVLGYNTTAFPSFEGQLAEFMIWDKIVTPQTVSKVFLMSYYGYTK